MLMSCQRQGGSTAFNRGQEGEGRHPPPFLLNYLLIVPGESFHMAANEPHAYVAGEAIERMACSDNIIRFTARRRSYNNMASA